MLNLRFLQGWMVGSALLCGPYHPSPALDLSVAHLHAIKYRQTFNSTLLYRSTVASRSFYPYPAQPRLQDHGLYGFGFAFNSSTSAVNSTISRRSVMTFFCMCRYRNKIVLPPQSSGISLHIRSSCFTLSTFCAVYRSLLIATIIYICLCGI